MSLLVKTLAPPSEAVGRRIDLGRGRFALVDSEDFVWLSKHRWFAKMSCTIWYAVRNEWINGKCVTIRMHREIMHTPKGMECHHIFSNSLDNRKAMLQNMSKLDHKNLHKTKVFIGDPDRTIAESSNNQHMSTQCA